MHGDGVHGGVAKAPDAAADVQEAVRGRPQGEVGGDGAEEDQAATAQVPGLLEVAPLDAREDLLQCQARTPVGRRGEPAARAGEVLTQVAAAGLQASVERRLPDSQRTRGVGGRLAAEVAQGHGGALVRG